MTVGEKIRERRIELGLTQEQLATICGYKSRASVNKIEMQRELPQKRLKFMAEALGVSPAYLLGWEDEQCLTAVPKDIINALAELRNEPLSWKFINVYSQLTKSKRESLSKLMLDLLQ